MACGWMLFIRKNQILEEKNSFYFNSINFFYVAYVITAPQTLKGSQNSQGFALIRAVLFAIYLLIRGKTQQFFSITKYILKQKCFFERLGFLIAT